MQTGDPRRFRLLRHVDVSGVSGTGLVATGTEFGDGTVALHWHGQDPSTTIFPGPNGIDAVQRIHGHSGSTVVEWIDPEPSPRAIPPGNPGAAPPDTSELGLAARSLDPLCPGMGTEQPEPHCLPPPPPDFPGAVRGR